MCPQTNFGLSSRHYHPPNLSPIIKHFPSFTSRAFAFGPPTLSSSLQFAIDYPSLLLCDCFASLPFCMDLTDFDLDFAGNAGTTHDISKISLM